MAAHRYWRLYVTVTPGGGNSVGLAEIELRSSIGGADLTGSGTASASNAFTGYPASNLVDNDTSSSSEWASYPNAPPQWWAYDFGSGVTHDIVQIVMTPRSGFLSEAPGSFQWQYSDDGSTWTPQASFSGVTWPSAASQSFTVGMVAAASVRQTQVALESAHVNPAALDLRTTQGALEHLYVRPNVVFATQICLEVAFPAYTPPVPASRRNHSFTGAYMGTGHADNASFNY